jgi:hypothetical protein
VGRLGRIALSSSEGPKPDSVNHHSNKVGYGLSEIRPCGPYALGLISSNRSWLRAVLMLGVPLS